MEIPKGKLPESLKIVEFPKRETFNQIFWKLSKENQTEKKANNFGINRLSSFLENVVPFISEKYFLCPGLGCLKGG